MKRIVIVDDNPIILLTLSSFLLSKFEVITFLNPVTALQYFESHVVDLILLDVYMPQMDGLDVLKQIQKQNNMIPVILMSSDETGKTEVKGLSIGAVDYIKKPIYQDSLLRRIHNHLKVTESIQTLKHHVEQMTSKMKSLEQSFITGLEITTKLKDAETAGHIHRIALISKRIAIELMKIGYCDISESWIEQIEQAAPFHDFGKLSISDEILKKPGKLTAEEFEIMKTHTSIGYEAIQSMIQEESPDFIYMAAEIALYHHEKWIGTGYPFGLSKTDIPLSARIVAVADVYDALVSARIYKPAYSHEEAIQIIHKDSGIHFDPTIVNAFISISYEIEEIMKIWIHLNN